MTKVQIWSLIGVALTLWLLILLEPILMPFFVSMILAYLGDPVTDRLEARGLSRRLAVSVVFLLLGVVIVGGMLVLVPMLGRQLAQLFEALPGIFNWVQVTILPEIRTLTGVDFTTDFDQLRDALMGNWRETGTFAASLLAQASRSGLAFAVWVGNIALIPVVTFYLLLDWDRIKGYVRDMLPRQVEPRVTALATECDEVLSAFLRGQLLVMLSLGVIYAIGLSVIGLKFGLLIGLMAGLASIVPYLGVIVGILAAGVVAFFQFEGWLPLIGVLVVFGIGQIAESTLLQPLLLGDKIGLHPVAVIFAVLAGGQLFGFTGILLALPAAAVVMVLLRYVYRRYRQSQLYDRSRQAGDRPSLSEQETP
ncbi:AI-2E family transporter [Salinicola avicenniae]|uniref:AI-2E family transporter n=1 Tax=Salinicola avicenniae TaxID=2916836 RepID=UPI0020742BA0|nr:MULTISPECIES: AI-2E family transporter [unclassified Salinicola]